MRNLTSAAAALLMAAVSTVLAAQPEVIDQVLVKVNGDIITKTDLEQKQIAALRQPNVDREALQNDEKLKAALAELTPRILVESIDELLLFQLGREKGLRLTDEMFNRWLSNLRKEQNLVEDAKFDAALKQEGLTLADLRRNVEKSFMITEVQRAEIGSKLQITEEEARQYYQTHRQEFSTPATVTLREIVIEVAGDAEGAALEAAKTRAAAVRARIAGGEDFATVATEVSAAASKANGGLIGPVQLADLAGQLQQAIEKMKPGDVTEPLRVSRGYQIIKLETLSSAAVQPFEAVRDLVADKVYTERQRIEMQKFLTRIRSQAIIVWKNDELKKAYESYLARQGSVPVTDPGIP